MNTKQVSFGLGGGEALRKLLSPHNWRGLTGMLQIAIDPIEVFWRYYFKAGRYPYKVRLRTPIGVINLELHSHQDFVTVHEVFFRQDYFFSGIGKSNFRVAVDFGANIGIASAFMLTRNCEVQVYSYEPVPANIARARKNLAPFATRLEFNECAVGTEFGTVRFGVEPTGRYGGIGLDRAEQIEVNCRNANDELQRILKKHSRIDVLKLDIEGMEVPILESLKFETLNSIGCIVAECDGSRVNLPDFKYEQYLSIAKYSSEHAAS